MKQVQAELGGRPFNNEDLLTIQQELTDAVQAQFLGKGPFILTGCVVSGPATAATVTAGIVCLDGQLLRYEGGSGIALPAQFQAGAVVQSDPRPYQTAGTKYCMREVPAELVASDPAYALGEFLPLDTWGGKRWEDVQRAQQWEVGDVKASANLVTANYDTTGLGKPGTPAWGWGLCNGQGGRADLREKFIAGYNPASPDYLVGATGGAANVTLDVSQIPSHTHDANFRITDSGATFPFVAAHNSAAGANGSDITTKATGGGLAHENRPPFYVLAMLQWVGY